MKKFSIILCFLAMKVFAAPVNINQADAETISGALNGIGPKKAEAIVKYRAEHGHFESLEDLEKVKGIGEKTLKANEKDIIFSDDAEKANPDEPSKKASSEKAE
jgi:competence protein ComEA